MMFRAEPKPIPVPKALITAGRRPASIYFRGGEVNILVHDTWYLGICHEFLAIARRTHIDKKNLEYKDNRHVSVGTTFVMAILRMREFQRLQAESWYKPLGLTPPRVRLSGLPTSTRPFQDIARRTTKLQIAQSMGMDL